MRVHGLIKLNLIRKIQNSVIICVLIYLGYLWNGLTGIGWSIFASTVISYIMMMLIIKNRIFPNNWKKLVLSPYYNGVILTFCWAVPSYLAYLALHSFIANEITSFVITCGVFAAVATLVFIKKPKLLGSDIYDIQEDFLQMFYRKRRKKEMAVGLNSEKV
jgi:hypothetical protein